MNAPTGPSEQARPTRRAVTTAVLLQLLVRTFGIISGIVVAAALARGLDHDDFGRFSLALSLVAMVALVGEFGITSTAIRHLAVHPESEAAVSGALVLIRSVTGVGGVVIVLAGAAISDKTGEVLPLAAVVSGSLLLSPLIALQPVGQARLQVNSLNALLLLQSLLWTAAVLTLAKSNGGVELYACAFLGVTAVYASASWLVFRPRVELTFVGSAAQARALFKVAWPVVTGGFFVTAYYRLDGIILFHYHGADISADFAAAYRFLDVLQVVPGTLLFVALPLLASTWRDPSAAALQRRKRVFELTLKAIGCIAFPVSVGGVIVSDRLTTTIYGQDFSASGQLLAILLAGFPAIAIGYVAVGLALASDRTRLYATVAAVAAVLNIIANVILIPRYAAEAAAWTTIATEYAVSAVLLVALAGPAGVATPWNSWFRTGIATSVSALVVLPFRDENLAVSLPAGAISFFIAGAALRILSRSDIRALISRERLEVI